VPSSRNDAPGSAEETLSPGPRIDPQAWRCIPARPSRMPSRGEATPGSSTIAWVPPNQQPELQTRRPRLDLKAVRDPWLDAVAVQGASSRRCMEPPRGFRVGIGNLWVLPRLPSFLELGLFQTVCLLSQVDLRWDLLRSEPKLQAGHSSSLGERRLFFRGLRKHVTEPGARDNPATVANLQTEARARTGGARVASGVG
jgi:hypothetical protein